MAIHLCGLPGDIGRAGRPTLGLAPGGGCLAAGVAPDAAALLPHRFTLACADPGRPGPAIGGLLSVALYRQVTPSWLSPAPVPCGVRTFLDAVPAHAAAATQPAHRQT